MVVVPGVGARQAVVQIDGDDIGGVVTGPTGPEAGVWVIAETTDLPTRFNRTVVTDDEGRYVVPDLPAATYDVWVRGYGLVDSPKQQVSPGTRLDLRAVVAPDARAAAQYYPAGYWYSLLEVPGPDEFPGTGPEGNGISPDVPSQAAWLRGLKSGGCTACHALGNKATREIPPQLGEFDSLVAAWDRRIQSGQAGRSMSGALDRMGRRRALEMYADWTGRIMAGEVPPAPPRPQGVERNVVITQWDWADPTAYLHDEASTDKRNPTVNANGPIYGALEASADYIPVLDPVRNAVREVRVPVRDPDTPRAGGPNLAPSPYWGDEAIWDSQANVHNPMLD
ncbi:MAG TPA: carboxypeptidase regulatory-like domain-containing protein, partial [Acidobacteria bacterium]|nr:carboxypeptidase regulatory-like domain-containing protein [Acidobacteriota bacterium]